MPSLDRHSLLGNLRRHSGEDHFSFQKNLFYDGTDLTQLKQSITWPFTERVLHVRLQTNPD